MENLSRDKQIEELTKDLYGYSIDTEEDSAYVAKILIDKGYRKASEVALGVISEIQAKIQIMVSSIKAQEEIGNISEFNGGAKTALEIVFKDIAELEKKYTEEGK